jgi:hypothetical protein
MKHPLYRHSYAPVSEASAKANAENAKNASLANMANTAARPGALTTEWWTVLIAGAASYVLAKIGLPGPTAAQVAGIAAPILLALVYAYVRARTKGALADALKAIFPQAGDAPGAAAGVAAVGAPGGNSDGVPQTPTTTKGLS